MMILLERLALLLILAVVVLVVVFWIFFDQASETASERTAMLPPGRFRQRLRKALAEDDAAGLRHLLETHLPMWPLRGALLQAVEELTMLSEAARLASEAGVPLMLVQRAQGEAQRSLEAVIELAVRTYTVAAQRVAYNDIREAAEQEVAQLHKVAEAAQAVRAGLARLTLTEGGDTETLSMAEQELRLLETAAGALGGEFG